MKFKLGLGSESGVRNIKEIQANSIEDAKKIYEANFFQDKQPYETIDLVN
jgi:hypothetical protein